MKIQLLTLLIAAVLTGCGTKNTTTGETTTTETTAADEPATVDSAATAGRCYALTTNGDTVRLSITQQGSYVSGTLYYQLSGKDRNTGNISGQMRGDTLLAKYTFQSEGTESVREVAFLAHNGGFVEGYGPVQEKGGQMVFTPNAPLTFSMDRVLMKTTCPNE